MKRGIGIALAVLLLAASIGCVGSLFHRDGEVEQISIPADRGAPDEVIRSFLCQFVISKDCRSYTYEAQHDVYSVMRDGEEYILDYLDFDVTETRDSGLYAVEGNVIFACRPDGSWAWNNWGFTAPQPIEAAQTAPGEEPATAPEEEPATAPEEEPAATPTPEPKEEPTATPTPEPREEPTATPSSFLFGGVEVQAGQSAVRVKGKKDALIRISPEEMDLLIKLCPDLSKLVLDYCCMADYSRIGELTGLKELEITTTTHEKDVGIPLTDIDWIASLHRLRSLTLCYNEISDIRALAELDALEELNLAWNKLEDNDLRWLSGLNLQKLYLYGNSYLKDVSELASIRSLELLHLGGCRKITRIDSLADLPYLKELDVSYCPLKDLLCFSDFKALKTLRLEHSDYVDFYYYYDLANCESLETIVISEKDTDIESALWGMITDMGRGDIEIVYWESYHES